MKILSAVFFVTSCVLLSGLSATSSAEPSVTLDVLPTPIKQLTPVYPPELYKQDVTGSAMVEIVVDSEGNVTRPKVVRATREEFGRAAVACVSQWKFSPGMKGGRTVAVLLDVPFVFEIQHKKKS